MPLPTRPTPPAKSKKIALAGPPSHPGRASRARLHRSQLLQWLDHIDALQQPAPARPLPPAQGRAEPPVKTASDATSMAEQLGAWLGWTDAIALAAVLNAPALQALPAAPGPAALRAAAEARRVQAELTAAIDAEPAFAETAEPPDVELAALLGHFRLHQRALASRLGPLRALVRRCLVAQGPAGAELAALDAVLEQALRDRETKLLSALPAQLSRAARAQAGATAAGPLARAALQAELAHRLQPIHGMLAAAGAGPLARST